MAQITELRGDSDAPGITELRGDSDAPGITGAPSASIVLKFHA